MLYDIIHSKTLYELLCVTWLCDDCDSDSDITLFFFLNQKFITWNAKVDYGSYFVTMYI